MRRILTALGALSVLLGLAITPAGARGLRSHAAKGIFTVGLVTDVGGINDKSFNHLAYVGLTQVEAHYPNIRGSYVESHAATDYVPNLTHYAKIGVGLTIGVGFLMENAIYTVAKQYPDRKFALIDGAPTDAKGHTVNLPNVANLFFKEQESGYLVGVIAGLMEKDHVGKAVHNVIGYMGGLSIPPVNRYIAGYIAGAKKVDPSIKILSNYSLSFTDQSKGKAIGLAQIGKGADILFQVAGASGLGYLAAAQQKGVYGIGVDADQSALGSFVMTSALKKVNAAVFITVRDAAHGKFKGGDHEFSLKNNATGFAKPASYVPASIVAQANHYASLIGNGKIVPPASIPAH